MDHLEGSKGGRYWAKILTPAIWHTNLVLRTAIAYSSNTQSKQTSLIMSFTSLQSVGNIGGAQGTLLPRSFSRALPSPRRTSRVEAASASQASTDEAMGFRYDASMQVSG